MPDPLELVGEMASPSVRRALRAARRRLRALPSGRPPPADPVYCRVSITRRGRCLRTQLEVRWTGRGWKFTARSAADGAVVAVHDVSPHLGGDTRLVRLPGWHVYTPYSRFGVALGVLFPDVIATIDRESN